MNPDMKFAESTRSSIVNVTWDVSASSCADRLVSSFFQVTYAQSLPAKYPDPMDIQEIPRVEGPSAECVSLASSSSSSSNIANLWAKRWQEVLCNRFLALGAKQPHKK